MANPLIKNTLNKTRDDSAISTYTVELFTLLPSGDHDVRPTHPFCLVLRCSETLQIS
jgi:hypothetical protein